MKTPDATLLSHQGFVQHLLREYHLVTISTQVVHAQAVNWLIATICWIVFLAGVSGALVVWIRHETRRAKAGEKDLFFFPDGYRDDGGYMLMCALAAIFGAVAVAVAAVNLANIWLWVGLYHPHLALAHEIAQRLLR